ncbi:hypothetical protein CD110_05400 [Staphylococcus casei]|uniref:cystatin-like fold lipoprotein n=1 Tax=Staphylococcus TaxID=1279 RepID=UPI000CD147F3|nr:cystatin-like fold lipoprotein [Staphylococcus casei]PNZ60193.1 hypothetical protein CD110_05400 [Staphylococcus casei]PTI80019.1 cystatin-like fold lipoprotein [Staphylococcus succinus]WJE86883.1 DUF4467 domain-containing protein [Staphylococcus casei]
MKKLLILIVVSVMISAGCSSSKYTDKIEKAVNQQQTYQKHLAQQQEGDAHKKFDKKEANIYVYEKGKYVTLAYKPLKEDAEVHYYTYEFKNGNAKYLSGFNSKGYTQTHEADYKEENMNMNE